MPSLVDDALDVTRDSVEFALVPAIATLLSLSEIVQALESGPGGGITFPFPTGLPTLWTYVSLSGVPTGPSIGGPRAFTLFVPLFVVGLFVTSGLEAGFLGSLNRRIDGRPPDFGRSVKRYLVRMVGVNLLRALVVFAVVPLIGVPPLAIVVVIGLMYLIYGLPFEIVVRDTDLLEAIEATVSNALDGGSYAAFGVAHLVAGALGSIFLTWIVRNGGIAGVALGTAIVAVPAVFVAVYGLLVFRGLGGGEMG